jgi:hypothetical protein
MLGNSKESLLTSFIARVSQGPSLSKWTSSFSKQVEKCCRSPPDRIGPQLVQFEEWLVPHKFENPSLQSQQDLLLLWECALKFSSERLAQQVHREVVSSNFFSSLVTTNSIYVFRLLD